MLVDTFTADFLAAASAGETIYITTVRKTYLQLDPKESFRADLHVTRVDGGRKVFALRLPRFAGYPKEGVAFVTDFFLAELYNILSSMGGRAVYLVNADDAPEAETLAQAFRHGFGVELPRHKRQGFGRCLNVIERMLEAILADRSEEERRLRFEVVATPPAPTAEPATNAANAREMFAAAVEGMEGRIFLGIDIGGTDIKLALCHDGRLTSLKEYDWNPASYTHSAQLIDPVLVLVDLMSLAAAVAAGCDHAGEISALLEPALRRDADVPCMEAALREVKTRFGFIGRPFDGIGMCFPDVVVNDKIVGGEVSKTRGIRNATGSGYDAEYARLTDLDDRLRKFVREGGAVGIVNDGPMAAFTAGVELAVKDPAAVGNGFFAYTLGTELGTGWVTEHGCIPDIPLEVYNFVIDMGSIPERQYEPDDLRSVNNLNTGIPGTLQKFASQSGVFRMALKYFPGRRDDLLAAMREQGFVVEENRAGQNGLYVPTMPRDLRKPFLKYMMSLVASEKDATVERIFEEIGMALAVTGEEIDWILSPAARRRMLFGRLVMDPMCFALIRKGALALDPGADLIVADAGIAATPLMRGLSESKEYTVAQFAQAVGAVHYANFVLRNS